MKAIACECHRFERIVLWLARGISVLALGMFTLFAVGEGVPNPFGAPWPEMIALCGFFGLVLGMILAWRWEALGGLIVVGSFAAFQAVEWVVNHHLVLNPPMILMGLPGVLFLVVAAWRLLHHRLMPPPVAACART